MRRYSTKRFKIMQEDELQEIIQEQPIRTRRMKDKNGNMNLLSFAKGVSGNPGGRPKGVSITKEINKLLKGNPEQILRKKPKTGLELLARGIFTQATKEDGALAREIWNRIDGKVPDVLKHTGDSDAPVEISIDDRRSEILRKLVQNVAGGATAEHSAGVDE